MVIFEVNAPDGEALLIEAGRNWCELPLVRKIELNSLFVEPFQGAVRPTSILVGVRAFPVLEVECRFQVIKGVLDLWLFGNERLVIIVIGDLRFGLFLRLRGSGRCSLGLLFLLGWGYPLQRLLDVRSLFVDTRELGLVHNGLQVPDEIREFGAQRGIDRDGCGSLNDGCDSDIGKGNTLTDEEGACGEVSFESVQGAELVLCGLCV